jgi:fructose-specific PTS system IIA-like component
MAPSQTLEHRFTFTLANGLHARPASMLVELVGRFKSTVKVRKVAPGEAPPSFPASAPEFIDARSVLSLVGLDIKKGDEFVVVVFGPDAAQTMATVRDAIEHKLAEGDELPPASTAEGSWHPRLPAGLKAINVRHAFGRTVSAGVGMGRAVMHMGVALPPELLSMPAGEPDREVDAACLAMAQVQRELEKRAKEAPTPTERELLSAHAAIASDPALRELVGQEAKAGVTGLVAVARATEKLAAKLRAAESAYIRDRAIDVHDVGMQIVTVLGRGQFAPCAPALAADSVVFAETLTPNQLLKMDRRMLKGLVLGRVGATSHTVILAKTMGVPAIINVNAPLSVAASGDRVVVDALAAGGFVVSQMSPEVARYYEREGRTRTRRLARVAPLVAGPVATNDGQPLEVGVNASTADEVAAGISGGADGVGLLRLRTELLFLDREDAPGEEEQHQAYSAVVSGTRLPPGELSAPAAAESQTRGATAPGRSPVPRSVIIRTFDIGGDKSAPYIVIPKEENPFLGVRGLRLYQAQPQLLRTQLRAILRASAGGNVKIMAPMVATPAEAAWFREQVRAAQAEQAREGVAFDRGIPVGAMIEIPAAALCIDHLAPHCDFFSIGTNDLLQYFMAVDRGNKHPALAALHDAHNPAFLRLLRTLVGAAKAAGKWIGVCGEMAGDESNLPLMIGLGVDEISVAPGAVLGLKRAATQAVAGRCRELLEAACECRNADDVERLLEAYPWRAAADVGIVDASLVDVASDARCKEEAIKDCVDLLFVAGRTEDPREVEAAVWAREATYSTALGFGFAVPHCKSTTISAPSLAVLKLAKPIDWGAKDGEPVSLVFLLAVPADDATGAHMKVFAKLARKLMHEEFRKRLSAAKDATAVETILREELGLE